MKNAANINTETEARKQTRRMIHGEILPDAKEGAKTSQTRSNAENNAGDSLPFQGRTRRRVSRLQLVALSEQLSERDLLVLGFIRKNHFVSSRQIQRLYFIGGSSDAANSRAANRALKRLGEQGLIAHLDRRIGGWRSGSSAQVWYLTEPGERLFRLGSTEKLPRKRPEKPSYLFLEQTLATTEKVVASICVRRDSISGAEENSAEKSAETPGLLAASELCLECPDGAT